MDNKPAIICLTPVKNEAWILDLFLRCTSLWADYIIIADQNSSDESREIALKYPKVILIDNKSTEYSENERQKLLIDKARSIEGKKLLVTLDADEFFTSDFQNTAEWDAMLKGIPGDSFGFRWINILPGFKKGWETKHFIWAMIDDGKEHKGEYIHSPRIPVTNQNRIIYFERIKVLHFQYINWERMESKHRYYQCLERVKYPEKRSIDLYRRYHHMNSVKWWELIDLNDTLFSEYESLGIKIREQPIENKAYWFDNEVLDLFRKYGLKKFKKESIWQANWNEIAHIFKLSFDNNLKDPRGLVDKLFHFWLKSTQLQKDKNIVRRIDRIINRFW